MPEGWVAAAVAFVGTAVSSLVVAGSWSRRQRAALGEEIELLGKLDPQARQAQELDAVIRLRLDRYRHRQELGILGWLMPAIMTTAVWWFIFWLPDRLSFFPEGMKPADLDVVARAIFILLGLEVGVATVAAIFRATAHSVFGRWMVELVTLTPPPPRPQPRAPDPTPPGTP